MMWTKTFWLAVGERAVRTFAQSLAALLAVDGLGVLDVEWMAVLSAAALTALLSILTSIGTGFVQDGDVAIDSGTQIVVGQPPAPGGASVPDVIADMAG